MTGAGKWTFREQFVTLGRECTVLTSPGPGRTLGFDAGNRPPPKIRGGNMADDVQEDRVRAYYELVDRGEVDGLVSLFADDAVYCRPGYPPLRGRADLERFYREDRVIESGAHTLDSLVSSPPRVAVSGEFSGMLRSGEQVDLRFADFFTFAADGHFARRDTFFFTPLV